MVAGRKGSGGSLYFRSDGGPLDLVLHSPAAVRFFSRFNICSWVFSEIAALVGSRGRVCTWLRLFSTCAQWGADAMEVADASSSLHSVPGWSISSARVTTILQKNGAVLEMAGSLIHGVGSPFLSGIQPKQSKLKFLSGIQPMQSKLEMCMVLQCFLHMRDGSSPLVPHCFTSFLVAFQGMCWIGGDGHMLNIMSDAVIWVLLYASNQTSEISSSSKKIISKCYGWTLVPPQRHLWQRPRVRHSASMISFYELHCNLSGCRALFLVQAVVHDEYVFLLFWTCRRRVRASLLRFLRFNGQEPPDLILVMAHLDFQLIPLPHTHLST